MAFKDLFKRQEGGTVVGNLIRGAVKTATSGLLGNGALMLKPGQTTAQNNSKALAGAGAGAVAFQNTAGTGEGSTAISGSISEKIKSGAIIETIKQNWYWFLIPVAGVVWFAFFRKKKKW